jgi:ATP-dependent DNA helicase PIF1
MDLTSLTAEQRSALNAVRAGKNTVVAGAAGSGKSHWIHAVKVYCPHCVVTATTGLAAVNVGGVTIHKFAGIGIADPGPNAHSAATPEDFIKIALEHISRKIRPDIRRIISRTPLLLIEEASMLSEYLYRLLDALFRLIRHDQTRSFGGMQIVLVGDMRQLAPVAKNRDHPMMGRFFFEAPGFDSTFTGGVHVFTRIFRQHSASLRALLNRAAVGALSEADV